MRKLIPVRLRNIGTSPAGFCLLFSLIAVALRLIIFDYPNFFSLKAVPNHDMYQGASFLATNMHSIRLSGEIAWWNPISDNGYAQYFQSFFSPLAPTCNHIVFILWAQLILVLSWLGIALPEYFQYLSINYIIFPFLTFLAFTSLCSLIFRHRATVVLVLIAYTFSGIGIWNGAWFYFQEPFSLFFLLAASISVLKVPTAKRLAIFFIAAIIQIISTNYWTVYSSWFAIIFLCTYMWAHPAQVFNLISRIREIVRTHQKPFLILTVLIGATLLIWAVIGISILIEQSGNYLRTTSPEGYTITDAYNRIVELRRFTTELFNPNILSATKFYPNSVGQTAEPPIHNARYIGAVLIPLLALIPAYRWHARERWLFSAALFTLMVCLGPPLLLIMWDVTPMMNRIIHFFYFYSHYWQTLVVVLAGLGVDFLLKEKIGFLTRLRAIVITSVLILLICLVFLYYTNTSFAFVDRSPQLEGNLRLALIVLLCSILILQSLLSPSYQSRRILILGFVLISFTDLTNYFWVTSSLDRDFTQRRWEGFQVQYPLPKNITDKLRQPWSSSVSTNNQFQADLFSNMPVPNSFWSINQYLIHRSVFQLRQTPAALQQKVLSSKPIDFYKEFTVLRSPEAISKLPTVDLERVINNLISNKVLLLQRQPRQSSLPNASLKPSRLGDLTYSWLNWTYNSFKFNVDVPQSGWLFIRQVSDPLWAIRVDGSTVRIQKANFGGMAIAISPGKHLIQMDYRPLARSLYWIACILLEITLLILGIVAFSIKLPSSVFKFSNRIDQR